MVRTALLLVALLVPLAAPSGMAQDDGRVLEASIVYVDALTMDRLEVTYPLVGPQEADVADGVQGCTAEGDVQTLREHEAFRFRDTDEQTSCAEAQFLISVPTEADGLTLHFRADRIIRQASSVTFPPSAVQSVRFRATDGALLEEVEYFDRSLQASPGSTFALRPQVGAQDLRIGWYFQDEGTTLLSPVGGPMPGQSLTATVSSALVEFDPVPLPDPDARTGTRILGDQRYSTLDVTLELDAARLAGRSARLQVAVVDGYDVDGLLAPDGAVYGSSQLQHLEGGDEDTVVVPEALVAEGGAGTYRLRLVGSAALEPVRVGPLAWGALLLPGIVGIVATDGHQRFRRDATVGQAGTISLHTGGLATTVIAYAAIALWVVLGGRVGAMSTLPLDQAGWVGYIGLFLILAAFLLLWGFGLVERRRSREIRHADDLARSNRDLEQFAYVASHDLQEPLRKVVSYTGLLEKKYGPELDDKAQQYLQNASDGARRMRRLIQALLEFSRVGAHIRPVEVDMNRLLDDVVEDLAEAVAEAEADVGADHHLPTLVADPELLHQVLLNLISNGIKYRHPDRRPVVRVRAVRRRAAWEFAVQDNGRGMDPDSVGKAFGIFQRLHTDTPGTGIGLTLCQRIVENHGGRMWAKSTPDVGSTFYFTLPVLGGRG